MLDGKSCLVFMLVQDAEITVTCTSQRFPGETAVFTPHLKTSKQDEIRVNSKFRTGWQRGFLLVVHYTSFNVHSNVFQSCSQTFMKIL